MVGDRVAHLQHDDLVAGRVERALRVRLGGGREQQAIVVRVAIARCAQASLAAATGCGALARGAAAAARGLRQTLPEEAAGRGGSGSGADAAGA